ncbi:MAG: hypothetical protein ACMUIP_01550 [bacterium]
MSSRRYFSPRFLAGKIGERGILYCLRAGTGKIYRRIHENKFYRRMRCKVWWVFPSLRFFFRPTAQSEKRILAIWDFRTVPYSIGDLIILHERIQIMRMTYKIDKADICFLYDPQNPGRRLDSLGVTADNYHYHFPALISALYLNPHVGAVFLFDSHDHMEDYIGTNEGRYHIWPEGKQYLAKHYAYAENFDFIQSFYRKNGFIPSIDYRASTLEWAYSFYKNHVLPSYPVVVHLRNNPVCGSNRNARLDEWHAFFKSCGDKFDIRFIMIGAASEIDERFRDLPNLLIAKDYRTTVEQDLVLAYSTLIFIGSSSGPSSAAIFSQTPYIIFNYQICNESVPHGGKFSFATDLQKLVWEPETSDILMEQFSDLFYRVHKSSWKEKMDSFMALREEGTYKSNVRWMEG